MSRPVNEPQVPATSSHAPHTSSSTPTTSEQATTRTGETDIPTQPRVAIGVSLSQNYPLHEFHSLLEAAQRIANSAPFDTEGDRWREDDQPEPIIHLNRRRTADQLSHRRTPLREYTRRPHVPGEDSGSEGESNESHRNLEVNSRLRERSANNLGWISHATEGVSESDADMNPYYAPLDSADPEAFRPRSDQGRTRDRQQEEEEERDLLEQALARSRAARSRFEADNQHTSLSNSLRTRYSTTGALPTSQSLYDWASEPMSTADDTAASLSRARSRAASIRRWRPAERLQDYASNHARRDSGNTVVPQHATATDTGNADNPPQAPAHDANLMFPELRSTTTPSRTSDTNLGSHEDVVDRVERALQHYRIARRALRPLNPDVAFEAIPNSNTNDSEHIRPSENEAASRYREYSDGLGHNGSDAVDSMDDVGFSGRTEPSGFGSSYYLSHPTLRWAPSGLTRREDPLRQRIREQIRERRRRGAQQALEAGNNREPPLARGPLFESGGTPQFAVPSDARQMIERVRQTNIREQSSELRRAKGALQYLAHLRDPEVDDVKAWTFAAELGLHNRGLDEVADKNLPWSTESLPTPSYSSWLEPGTTWTGVQDANDTSEKPFRPSRTPHDVNTEGDQRERPDPAARRESFRTRMRSIQDPLERTFLGDGTRDPVDLATSSMQMLEHAERSLSSMLERSEELLRENDRQLQDNNEQLRQSRERLRDTDQRLTLINEVVRRRAEARARQIATISGTPHSDATPDSDWWNVKVTLHSVDEQQMTVSGTMTASHKLHRPSYNVASNTDNATDGEENGEASMDSFFTGEIIDFVRHGLDTPPSSNNSKTSNNAVNSRHRRQQDEWKVGGPEIDLLYWAGIGPFKHEVDRAIRAKEYDHPRSSRLEEERRDKHSMNNTDADTTGRNSNRNLDHVDKQIPRDDLDILVLSEEEKYTIKMDTMSNLLCNTKWLNENIGAEGWILMRWKERCFVAPGTEPNPDVRRPWMSNQLREPSQSMNLAASGEDTSAWNVNDLIAQNRIRRRRERDARVWSTNAAEREELSTSSGPFTSTTTGTEPGSGSGSGSQQNMAWGLTISGFYYVALERKTGRIEAMYYDVGSTPFQKLKMSPQTLYRVPPPATTAVRSALRDRGRDSGDQDVAMTLNDAAEDMDQRPDFSGIAGLKTSFSVVEFR